uniref:Helicase C-terminal domain-containing protein n=1 Tax=Parastrongyloides trichosuri TaxID=131310 RepID=A0A0N4Z1D3_PARTI
WEISIMLLPKDIVMVLLSATMPNNDQIANWISTTQGRTMHVVGTCVRPVPLKFMAYSDENSECYSVKEENKFLDQGAIHEIMSRKNEAYVGKKEVKAVIKYIADRNAYPCFIYSPTKMKCETFANYLNLFDFLDEEEKDLIDKLIRHVMDTIGMDQKCLEQLFEFKQYFMRGIFIHHSDLYLAVKEFTEVCIEKGLAKVTCTTDTLGIGLNLPVKTVVFTALKKFDGVESKKINGFRISSNGWQSRKKRKRCYWICYS